MAVGAEVLTKIIAKKMEIDFNDKFNKVDGKLSDIYSKIGNIEKTY